MVILMELSIDYHGIDLVKASFWGFLETLFLRYFSKKKFKTNIRILIYLYTGEFLLFQNYLNLNYFDD